MIINDVEFNSDLYEIMDELISQMRINDLPYFEKGYKQTKNSLQVQCPYHSDGQERRPSAGIRMSDGMFHCFACGEIHTLSEVITHCFGHDDDLIDKFGWSWLIKNFATVSIEERKDIELDLERGPKSDEPSPEYVTEEELDKYRYYHRYWKKRKITDENIIELFDLGYDKETSCITMPVRDINGNCLFVARRSVHYKYFNYPRGVQKPLYGLYELKCKARELDNTYTNKYGKIETAPGEIWMQTIIVCESMIDALTCWQYGKYAVALNGLGTKLQFEQLRQLPCRKLILATDNDEAGLNARARIEKNVTNKIITEYILPAGRKDINELSREEFDALEEIL